MSREKLQRADQSEDLLNLFSPEEREELLADEQVRQAVSALCTHSPALTLSLSSHPEQARRLFLNRAFLNSAAPGYLAGELESQIRPDLGFPDFQKTLRLFRLKEIARLSLRDLMGLAGLEEVMGTLSALAETCLRQSLAFGVKAALEKFKLAPPELPLAPVILGMGKLGGRELNYSSDVDLVYLYKPLATGTRSSELEVPADFIFTLVTRAMSELTPDGIVFRVDLNLRPGGKDGAHARTLDGAVRHYQFLGQPWERMALLKARPVAGDLEAGADFLQSLTPFIFRRHLDYSALEELKILKARIAAEGRSRFFHVPGKLSGQPAVNVKLSAGGIREIEFFTQALIITFGGRLPHLRLAATLPALKALAADELISPDDAAELSEAYEFLRNVEHRLQLPEMTQTQTLPQHRPALDRLALAMGFADLQAFLSRLREQMDKVAARFNNLLAEPDESSRKVLETPEQEKLQKVRQLLDNLDKTAESLNILKELGFKNLEAALTSYRTIREQRYLPDPRYRLRLERLMPYFILKTANAPLPDKALSHLERFLIRIGPMGGLLLLLEENPILLDLLSTLFGTSDYLSNILINHPVILDSLVDRRNERLVKDKTALTNDLAAALYDEQDPEARLSLLHRFKNDEILRVGLFDILGQLDLDQVQEQLTLLAEVVIEFVYRLASELVPGGKELPVAIMGLGRLGGRELSYSSDLDLLFILGGRSGIKGKNMETAVRVVQRFFSFVSMYLPEGPGYQIDARLRPSGTSGPLVVVPSAFRAYHQKSQLWERQTLLKIRPVFGPSDLGKRIKAMADAAIYHRPLASDAAIQIDSLRRRMTRERARLRAGTINLKFSPGGMVDAEFITQYLQLVHGRETRGGVRSVSTLEALKALDRKRLGPSGLNELAGAHAFISGLANRLGLMYGRSGDESAYSEEDIAALDPPGRGLNSLASLRQAMSTVTRFYTQVFRQGNSYAG